MSGEIKAKPLKKHEYKRPGNFLRYIVYPDPELDKRYDYEATQDDLLFLTELKGSPFTLNDFEQMINFFEKENADSEETVKPFSVIIKKAKNPIMDNHPVPAERVYEYWKQVRSNRGGMKGLLKKYWKAPDPMNNDPKVTFRRLKEEKRILRRNRKYDEDYLKKVANSIICRWRLLRRFYKELKN